MGSNRSINQSGAVIPQDWHDSGWAKVTFFIPDSLMWRVTVLGLIDLLGQGRFWRSDGPRKAQNAQAIEIIDVIKIGRLIREFVMIKPEEYLQRELKTREEQEFILKKIYSLLSSNKTIQFYIDKPDEPTATVPNPTLENNDKSLLEYQTTIGGGMGLGEILGTALLDDLDINPLPNPFGQASKLDPIKAEIEAIAGDIQAIKTESRSFNSFAQGNWYELIQWFAGSFREGAWSNFNPFTQKTFFKMTQDSLNDTSALFGADKPYLSLIVENLIEKRFYLARLYALVSNNKAVKWFGVKPDAPGLFTPNPSIVNNDTLTANAVDLATVNQTLQTIADNSNKYEYSLFELMATAKHLLAKFSKSRAIPYQMPYPVPNDSNFESWGETVFGVWENGQVADSLADIAKSGLLNDDKMAWLGIISDKVDFIQHYADKAQQYLEWIGKGLNVTPFISGTNIGLAEVLARMGFSMGDWRYPENSWLKAIAGLTFTANPVINNQLEQTITVPVPTIHNELKQTINVDACCDDGTSDTPTDPVDPTDPTSPDQSPYTPQTPVVLTPIPITTPTPSNTQLIALAHQKNGFCGYITYRTNQVKGFFKALDELLEPMTLLYNTFGSSWIAGYLKQTYPKTPVLGGVYLVKMPTISLVKVTELYFKGNALLIANNMAFDLVIEWCDIFINNVACGVTDEITEDTALDGTYFYSSFANAAINSGGMDDVVRIWAEIVKDVIDYKVYGLGVQSNDFADYEQYCGCPVDIPEPTPLTCNTQPPMAFGLSHSVVSAPFYTNDTDNVLKPYVWSEPFPMAGGDYHQFVFEFDTLYNFGIAALPSDVIGVFDVFLRMERSYRASDGTQQWNIFSNLDFGLDDYGAMTIPEANNIYVTNTRNGNWTWEVSENKLKICIVVKTYDTYADGNLSPSPYPESNFYRLTVWPRVYINDPETPLSLNGSFSIDPSQGDTTIGIDIGQQSNVVKVTISDENGYIDFEPQQGQQYVTQSVFGLPLTRHDLYWQNSVNNATLRKLYNEAVVNQLTLINANVATIPVSEPLNYDVVVELEGGSSKTGQVSVTVPTRTWKRHSIVKTSYSQTFDQSLVKGLYAQGLFFVKDVNIPDTLHAVKSSEGSIFATEQVMCKALHVATVATKPTSNDAYYQIDTGEVDGMMFAIVYSNDSQALEYNIQWHNDSLFLALKEGQGNPLAVAGQDALTVQNLAGYYTSADSYSYALGTYLPVSAWVSFQVKAVAGKTPGALTVGLFNASGTLLGQQGLSNCKYINVDDVTIVAGYYNHSELNVSYVTLVTVEWT